MSRSFTTHADESAKGLLNALAALDTSVPSYREAMRLLGHRIATIAIAMAPEARNRDVCVLCTVEDADFLARGIVEGLERAGLSPDRIRLACFWNERVRRFKGDNEDSIDVAPIIKQYREPTNVHESVLILAKSIIRGTCVVKTNLASLLDSQVPRRIIVAAPVMLNTAPAKLAKEFPTEVADKFEYLVFAIDDKKDDQGNVLPGVGGSPYIRLGFEDKKNDHVPALVRERRRELSAHL